MAPLTPDERERLVVFSALAAAGASLHLVAGVPAFKAFLLCVLVRPRGSGGDVQGHGARRAACAAPGRRRAPAATRRDA
jgi:hypothetical protein